MSAFKNNSNDDLFGAAVDAHDDPKSKMKSMIRDFEKTEAAVTRKAFTLSADALELLIDMTDHEIALAKNFNWVKGIIEVKRQSNGGINLVCVNNFFASRIFDFIGFKLEAHYQTKKICTSINGKPVRYLDVALSEDRALTPETKNLLNQMRENG